MWNETLIESRRGQGRKPKWLVVTLSIALHVGILTALVFSSYWVVEAVPPTFPRMPFVTGASIPVDSPIQVQIKHGSLAGNDIPAPEVTPASQVAPVTQESITPDGDIEEPSAPVQEGSWAAVGEEFGTGPLGDPKGNSETGSISGPVGNVEPEPIVIQTGVEPPVLVHRVQPEYPEMMRRARIEGVVILHAVISRTGDVEVREVLRSVHPMLDQAAMRAVNQWKYSPATVAGRPVRVWFTVTVSFRLQ